MIHLFSPLLSFHHLLLLNTSFVVGYLRICSLSLRGHSNSRRGSLYQPMKRRVTCAELPRSSSGFLTYEKSVREEGLGEVKREWGEGEGVRKEGKPW